MSKFIHLTNKTEYSLSEGAVTISRISELCDAFNMPAVGISDTNNMFGALEFSDKILKSGIQPIIGCNIKMKTPVEFNVDKNIDNSTSFLNLFAKNLIGYQNLLELSSRVYTKYYLDNSINLEDLYEKKEGIILLTGGTRNLLNILFDNNKVSEASHYLDNLKENFKDNLYIEIQRTDFNSKKNESHILSMAFEKEIPLVATNEVYFESPEYYEAHDALSCIEAKQFVSQENRKKYSDQHYFKSDEEMQNLFADIPESISNTLEIAKRCSFAPKVKNPILPVFTEDKNISEKDLLIKLSNDGLQQRLERVLEKNINLNNQAIADINNKYQERLNSELKIIISMKYEGYFLIVSDFIQWAKNNNIPVGPGRGSGAGSLVAWCLGITDLDPIYFGLIFERFLNPERVSLPDFDIDFCRDRRDEVLNYVYNKYGKEKVAQIITFGKLQARAVLRDVGRVLGIPYGQVDYLCKLIPFDPSRQLSLQEYIDDEPKLNEEAEKNPKIKKLLNIALKLEGLKRHASIHAAGVVISKDTIYKDVPLYSDPDSNIYLTQFDMKWVENAGLVKFDFLGLKTLTLIQNCVELANKNGASLDISKIDITDSKTFDLLSTGETTGIFQLESPGMKETLKNLKPDKFEDIIALVALYRPGPMANIPTYIERKHGREKPEYIHPLLKDLLMETYGVVIYQEQVMGVARELSGYTDGEADLLRRAMGKKIQKEMNSQKKRFIKGCIEKGLKDNESNKIFDLLSKFADYGFNKSHAAAYALIAFQTAYLKSHFPIEFFAASMSLDINNTDKLSIFQQELDRMKIRLTPPSVNSSKAYFERDGDGISYALGAIKNVGIEAIKELVEERNKNSSYNSFNEFLSRVSTSVANKKTIEALVCAGAFDCFKIDRSLIFNQCSEIIKHIKNHHDSNQSNQEDIFGERGEFNYNFIDSTKWSEEHKLMKEFEMLGFYLSGHPMQQYKGYFSDLNIKEFIEIKNTIGLQNEKNLLITGTLLSKKEKRSARGNAYAFLSFSDLSFIYELIIFENNLRKYRDILIEGNSYAIGVDFKNDNGSLTGEVKKIFDIKDVIRMNKKPFSSSTLKNINKNKENKELVFEEIKISILQIYVNSEFSIELFKRIKINKGHSKIKITYDNQRLTLPGEYEINQRLISEIKLLKGVKEIQFD